MALLYALFCKITTEHIYQQKANLDKCRELSTTEIHSNTPLTYQRTILRDCWYLWVGTISYNIRSKNQDGSEGQYAIPTSAVGFSCYD